MIPMRYKKYVPKPNVNVDMNVPSIAKHRMAPILSKKALFLRVNPAANTMGGKNA